MSPSVDRVTFEHHREALGIGESEPRISWKTQTDEPGWRQVGYELEISTPGGPPTLSGRTDSADSVLVPWPEAALLSRSSRTVSVRVWGTSEHDTGNEFPSDWSPPATLEVGLLEDADWTAQLITPIWAEDTSIDLPPALFRREFAVAADIAAARLYVTAHGVFEVEINGAVVGVDVLAPGWSSYRHRLRYSTYDVTALIVKGANAIGATVADGWFRGLLGFEGGKRNVYGEQLALLAQLEIRYRDGNVQTVRTDEHWRAGPGPIRATGIYPGEIYDARAELDGWSGPGFADDGWSAVQTKPLDLGILVAPPGPPVRRIEEVTPVSVITSPSGRTLVDFGQNLVGRLRIRVTGPAGQVVTLRHAEVLEHGELGTRPLRVAKATDQYILRGSGAAEVWEPRFTYHGFRYARIDGWPGEFDPAHVTAIVLHTDMERTGWFDCSDDLVNRLHENVVWGMRGNFLDLPTDCPQRDERLGWTGDIQVFTPTARFLYDCTGMLSSWLADLAAEQIELGTVPVYIPFIQLGFFRAAPVAAWGDAAVIVPWELYRRDGDLELLLRQYPSMTAWVDQVAGLTGNSHLWDRGMQLGDWLDPAAPPDHPAAARTDAKMVATAYHAVTASIVSEAAGILGLTADHDRYSRLTDAVRSAFGREYVSPSGRMVSDAPTAFALALRFGLLQPEQRTRAGARLVELVKADRHRIATGFVGTPIVCDALTDVGAVDTAYHLLLQQECPSWLYPVTMGATTIWERWDSMLPDGSINPGDMTSFNHYALGAVADWLHRTVAGLGPGAPGYRSLTVAPQPGGGLTYATAAHETPYGRAEVTWRREADELTVTVLVPPNVTASVRLPEEDWGVRKVGSGTHSFSCRVRPAELDPPIPVWNPFADLSHD